MARVVSFGEALVDFVSEPQAEGAPPAFRQHAGGAPANVAVAVSRLGGQASFVGGLATDPFGDFLLESLNRAGVGTEGVVRMPRARTALAFVFLDASGERSFRFYPDSAAHLAFRPGDFREGDFGPGMVFHAGSNTLTDPASAETTLQALERAGRAGSVPSFDLNWRPLLWPPGRDPRDPIWQALERVHLVKLSREELDWLAQAEGGEGLVIKRLKDAHARLIVVTDGPRPLRYFTSGYEGEIPAWTVAARDTTAAGDAFWGGLLGELVREGNPGACLASWLSGRERLEPALRFAAAAGALAVTRTGAFGAMPHRSEVKSFLEGRA